MSAAFDAFIAYKFVELLSKPWIEFKAYKLGIIDENGNILRTRKSLTTDAEKNSYTLLHRLIWKLRKLFEKFPPMKARISKFATAVWFLKENFGSQLQDPLLFDKLVLKECQSRGYKFGEIVLSESPKSQSLSPGVYKIRDVNLMVVLAESIYPVGVSLGLPIYRLETCGKMRYLTDGELQKHSTIATD